MRVMQPRNVFNQTMMYAAPAASAFTSSSSSIRLIHSRAILTAPVSSIPLQSPAAAAAPAVPAEEAAYPQLVQEVDDDSAGPTFQSNIGRTWHLFDARDQVVGRMAGRIATLLMGKNKPSYTPWIDQGDAVVVLNAKYLKFTGNKWTQKLYRYHTGYPGGLKEIPAERWRTSHPDRILRHAVAGMIRKNKLKIPRLDRLKIYSGVVHPHQAQFPFDMVANVPKLKAQRDEEIKEIKAKAQAEIDALNLAATGGKKAAAAPVAKKSAIVVPVDDNTMPENPEIRTAILKDREQRKGKPIVML